MWGRVTQGTTTARSACGRSCRRAGAAGVGLATRARDCRARRGAAACGARRGRASRWRARTRARRRARARTCRRATRAASTARASATPRSASAGASTRTAPSCPARAPRYARFERLDTHLLRNLHDRYFSLPVIIGRSDGSPLRLSFESEHLLLCGR